VKAASRRSRKPSRGHARLGHQYPHHALHPRHRLWRASYPVMVRNFQRVIGDEARGRFLKQEKRLPDCSWLRRRRLECEWTFIRFSKDKSVRWSVWKRRALASNPTSTRGFSMAARSACCRARAVLQDKNGKIQLTHSVSAGLDYAAVGPEPRVVYEPGNGGIHLHTEGRRGIGAFMKLGRVGSINPRRWKAPHAIAEVMKARAEDEPEQAHHR